MSVRHLQTISLFKGTHTLSKSRSGFCESPHHTRDQETQDESCQEGPVLLSKGSQASPQAAGTEPMPAPPAIWFGKAGGEPSAHTQTALQYGRPSLWAGGGWLLLKHTGAGLLA